ncbi:hypothetical protein Vqi01_12890 [Micromonospora qiuiae]|uniref:DUF4190 domain-containing protein n=1 Tax=Micromonospora qiuiae TaxID=502268 RepID=A0ABQ4J7J2_9ACTN|nr:DUF4190 domain-containing protein [Micromonospora qiuiae]GIJ26127.1 hypothetical protein Vqi01_12890 [Micromonospora qiuiae]
MQSDNPGQDPYGQQPPYGDPTAPPPVNPYAPPPANPYAPPPANPYAPPADQGTPPANPYAPPADQGTPPVDPYAPPADQGTPPTDPYGQQPPTPGQPYDPYAPLPVGQPPAYGQPHPPPYAGQPYGGTPMYPHAGFAGPSGQQNTLGLVAMILGIASIPLNCCYLGVPLGLAAVITGWLGKQKADQGLASNSGQALAGLICGAIGILLTLGYFGLLAVNFTLP